MSNAGDRPSDRGGSESWRGFVASVPLLSVTGALFIGSYVVYREYPNVGPDHFPLWGLLLTLGFVAAIGSVLSWFFATGTDETEVTARDDQAGDASPDSPVPRREFGRPVPDRAARPPVPARSGIATPAVAAAGAGVTGGGGSASAPWDEDVLPPVAAKGPRPVLTTLDDPGEIGRALEEIADIQRQLTARPSARPAVAESSARA